MFIKETLARESGLWPGITADSDQTVCYTIFIEAHLCNKTNEV